MQSINISIKGYSVILTTFFLHESADISKKKFTSKISVDSNFPFTDYT